MDSIDENDQQIYQISVKQLEFNNEQCILLTAHDISETIKSHIQEDINQYKIQVLSSFSHELRTPLNGAIIPLQLVMKNKSISQKIKKSNIENSLISLFILENTLNNIVDLSLKLSNQFSLIITNVDLKNLIKQIKLIAETQANYKKIKFEAYHNELPNTFITDNKRLKEILINLLSNAIKFTTEGVISLQILYNQTENQIKFAISDTGIGINKQQVLSLQQLLKNQFNSNFNSKNINETDKIYLIIIINLQVAAQGYQQVKCFHCSQDQIYQKEQLLHLIMDKALFFLLLQKKNNQKIFIKKLFLDSIPNEKINQTENELNSYHSEEISEFTLTKNQEIPLFFNKPSKFCLQKYFLLVDDDCFNLQALELNLKSFGKKCLTAYNGEKAIEILLEIYKNDYIKKEVSLIFMDYQMPIMNGVQATKKIKEFINQKLLPEIPIVACTAFGAKDQLQECIEAGMIDYLIKPVSHKCLKEFLLKWKSIL